MKYVDPDGNAGEVAEFAQGIIQNSQQYGELAVIALVSATALYLCTPEGQAAVANATNAIVTDIATVDR